MSVRLANREDIPEILSIYAPYVLDTTFSFEYTVPSLSDFTQRFDAITAQFPWLVWEERGQILGYAYGSLPFERDAYAWCCEASVYLRQDARGKGLGKELYRILESLLKAQGYKTLYAIITSQNQASLAFHEAVGYKTVASFPNCGYKKGAWLGTVWMGKSLAPLDNPTEKPMIFPKLLEKNGYLSDYFPDFPLSYGEKM